MPEIHSNFKDFLNKTEPDLVFVLSKLCRGSLEDKLRWTFRLYDTNNDNTISQQEMEDVISSVAFLTGLYDEEDIERRIKLWVESIFECVKSGSCRSPETAYKNIRVMHHVLADIGTEQQTK
ncbi:hypothetical protein QYM36_019219 [Artemia franciscana]|uniref:EF-hand domain-containing protein n=1 Tax=Artemia franciscana TaxID=6661 RepID=A0AA88H5K2_ARTSF|nr:hypothetical protein QYM36_019219 [Artemia franciscana]